MTLHLNGRDGEAYRRLAARNMQLAAALSAVRDMLEAGDAEGAKAACEEQAGRSWADSE